MISLEEYIHTTDKTKMLSEMAVVGNMNNDLKLYIRMNDPGYIPHFHVVDSETDGDKFSTCIEIRKNKYFHHTGKEDSLNSKQRKELNLFLQSNHRKRNYTNWEYLLTLWNDNNSKIEVDEDKVQPDYTIIEEN